MQELSSQVKIRKLNRWVGPFVGRLDDIGQNGMDLVKNIQRMYASGDGHVLALGASILN
jgi:transaldolase